MPEGVPRTGLGFDVHRFTTDRELWLGGVLFDGEDGLMGHSDGDVVCHAVADALLGAAALGDVGEHFPEDDPSFEGISALDLLDAVRALLHAAGFRPSSFDVTVVCDRPRIATRRDDMRSAMARVLGLEIDRCSVKATRPEGLGLAGDGVGCLAVAVVV